MLSAGIQATTHTFTDVVSAYGRARDAAGCEHWLGRFIVSGAKVNVAAFSATIAAYAAAADAGAARRAEFWLREMANHRLDPNELCFGGAIQAHVKKKK